MPLSYFWVTVFQRYLGLDLPINTNHSFEVPSTHVDFLKHIPNSEHSHSKKKITCVHYSTNFVPLYSLTSPQRSKQQKNERKHKVAVAYTCRWQRDENSCVERGEKGVARTLRFPKRNHSKKLKVLPPEFNLFFFLF